MGIEVIVKKREWSTRQTGASKAIRSENHGYQNETRGKNLKARIPTPEPRSSLSWPFVVKTDEFTSVIWKNGCHNKKFITQTSGQRLNLEYILTYTLKEGNFNQLERPKSWRSLITRKMHAKNGRRHKHQVAKDKGWQSCTSSVH